MKNIILLFLAIVTLVACNEATDSSATAPATLAAKANELAHRYIIADGHVDLPYRMKVKNFRLDREYLSIGEVTPEGHFDFVRARAGGLDAPFMSIYIPSETQKTPGSSFALADSLIDMVERLVSLQPDKAAIATSPDQIEANFAAGKISLPLGMENGAPIGTDLANLQHFYDRGIRYITLTHAKDNEICDSSYDTTRTWNGLSPFGSEVVTEMNRLGIMVDISHVSDSTFYQVLEIAKAPVIASHSSSRYFTPGLERNMGDDMLKALAKNDGVIMISFGSYFTGSLPAAAWEEHGTEIETWMEATNSLHFDSAFNEFVAQYFAEGDTVTGTVAVVADHIDRVLKLAGIDHVGLGSDFDGVGMVPKGISDVSMYPALIEELLRRGYSEEDIAKICSGNLFRVWRKVEQVASGG
ncbi:MAG: dipeptidase [Bacteroidia bacterium]|nr:dipeptidase [Bacteroidia bacterium]